MKKYIFLKLAYNFCSKNVLETLQRCYRYDFSLLLYVKISSKYTTINVLIRKYNSWGT